VDTRNKIISAEAALDIAQRLHAQGRKLTVVTGIFDVLVAAHARALGEARNPLMVVLLPSPRPLLPERARAELVAGLSMVDYVVAGAETGMEAFLGRLGADELISRQVLDEREQRQLIEHVQRRHKG